MHDLFIAKNKKQHEAMDPINALQNLASQGTRNPMPQMMNMNNAMGMANTNPNVNVLQNLMQRANQPQQMQMGGMQGIRNPMGNMMSNAMVNQMQQSGMAAGPMNPNAMSKSLNMKICRFESIVKC